MINVSRGPMSLITLCAVCGKPIRRSEVYTIRRTATAIAGRYYVRYAHMACDAPKKRGERER